MHWGNGLHLQPLRSGGMSNPVPNKVSQSRVIAMLQFAAPAFAKVATHRIDMVRARNDRPIRVDHVTRRGSRHMPS